MSKRKLGTIFVQMERSETFAKEYIGHLLGVFHPRKYFVVIPSGYLVIYITHEEQQHGTSDITNMANTRHTSRSNVWTSGHHVGDSVDFNTKNANMFYVEVEYEFIIANTPRNVTEMIFCTLSGLGKMEIE